MPNPKKIGGYIILSEIGSGGSGAVYRARDSLNDRDVALKILPQTDGPDDLARFRREAWRAREIDHPNVIRTLDYGEDGGVRFIAMELMAVSLREILAKGRLSLSRSLDIFRQAALGLRTVHERGGVHGGVKPGGILFDSAGAVKVAGFGSARADDLTMTAYKPPELWRGERADVRSDVYSLGAALHEALTGEAPFAADGESPIKQVRPGVPTGLARIVENCMELDPKRRWQTMDELLDSISLELVNRCALIDFYEATSGDIWKRSHNWLADDEPLDNWHGVTANRDGVVVGLKLNWNSLEGELPPELGGLTKLEWLNLSDNRLSGNIPPELGGLAKLKELDLSCNDGLSGSVPPELGGLAELEELDLSDNRLSGNIPPELGGLTELKWLSISLNRLSGNIPPELGGLAKLEYLILSDNRLSGSIPLELASLAKLRHLYLGDNGLSGVIPPELGGLTELEWLDLNENRLSGNIPPELGGLTELEWLSLMDNRLSGNIPPELGGLTKLSHIFLDDNRLSGSAPPELGGLTELRALGLSDNRLSGNIPPELGGLAELRLLRLGGNDWTGCIPKALLDISSNSLDRIDLPVCDG